MKRVLITGGAGYIGSRLANRLLKQGFSVTVADKIKRKQSNVSLNSKIVYRQGDLRNPLFAAKAVRGIQYVIHLAANLGPLTYMRDHQAEILQENTAIDCAIYPASLGAKVKGMVYSSSSMVFQHAPKFPYRESDINKITPPTNVYGFSKLVGEYFCRSYHGQFGLDYVIIRYHNVYGPGEDSKGSSPGDIHVIPALLEKVIIKKQYPLELLGNPHSTRPFVYVDDAVQATVKIFKKLVNGDKRILNTDLNIGNETHYQIIDLAKIIWKLVGDGRKFRYVAIKSDADTALRREVDITKIKKFVGWRPKTSLEQGILRTAEWIRTRR